MSEDIDNESWVSVACPICGGLKDLSEIPCEGQLAYIDCSRCEINFAARMPTEGLP